MGISTKCSWRFCAIPSLPRRLYLHFKTASSQLISNHSRSLFKAVQSGRSHFHIHECPLQVPITRLRASPVTLRASCRLTAWSARLFHQSLCGVWRARGVSPLLAPAAHGPWGLLCGAGFCRGSPYAGSDQLQLALCSSSLSQMGRGWPRRFNILSNSTFCSR